MRCCKRIRKDIKIEQVYETAQKMLKYGIAGHFPFIVGFPDESDARYPGHPGLRQATALDEPGLPDADLLLQALSRAANWSSKRSRAAYVCRKRWRPGPNSTTWPASPGPGCRRRNSSTSSASNSSTSWHGSGCRAANVCCSRVARYRCEKHNYRWPVEMLFTRWLVARRRRCHERRRATIPLRRAAAQCRPGAGTGEARRQGADSRQPLAGKHALRRFSAGADLRRRRIVVTPSVFNPKAAAHRGIFRLRQIDSALIGADSEVLDMGTGIRGVRGVCRQACARGSWRSTSIRPRCAAPASTRC